MKHEVGGKKLGQYFLPFSVIPPPKFLTSLLILLPSNKMPIKISHFYKLKSSGCLQAPCLQRSSPALGFCETGYYLISDTGFTKADFTGNAFFFAADLMTS